MFDRPVRLPKMASSCGHGRFAGVNTGFVTVQCQWQSVDSNWQWKGLMRKFLEAEQKSGLPPTFSSFVIACSDGRILWSLVEWDRRGVSVGHGQGLLGAKIRTTIALIQLRFRARVAREQIELVVWSPAFSVWYIYAGCQAWHTTESWALKANNGVAV